MSGVYNAGILKLLKEHSRTTCWKLQAVASVARAHMDFSNTSRAREARALASSIFDALIISLTKSSTHSVLSICTTFAEDKSSAGVVSPLVVAVPAIK